MPELKTVTAVNFNEEIAREADLVSHEDNHMNPHEVTADQLLDPATDGDITSGTSTEIKNFTPAQLKLAAETHGIINHNDLTSIQGGTTDEYYHLTAARHAVATQAATAGQNGYLTSANWSTFNGKVSPGKEYSVDIDSSSNLLTLDTTKNINCHILTESTELQLVDTAGWSNDDVLRMDFFVKVDAGGSYALTFESGWLFDGGSAPTLTATADAVDHLVITIIKSADVGTLQIIGIAAADVS